MILTLNTVIKLMRVRLNSRVMQASYTPMRGYGDYEDEDTSIKVVDTTDTDKPVIERAKLKREYTSPLVKILGKLHAPPIMDGRIKLKDTMDKNLKN